MEPLWLSFHTDQADPWSLTCSREWPNGAWWEAAVQPLLLLMLPHRDKRLGQGSPKEEHTARITCCVWDSPKKDQEKDFWEPIHFLFPILEENTPCSFGTRL